MIGLNPDDASENPLPGDCWRVGMDYHIVVVKVTPRLVWTIEGRFGRHRQGGEVHQWLREQFSTRMRSRWHDDNPFRSSAGRNNGRNAPLAELYRREEKVEGWLEQAVGEHVPWHEHGKI